jgi:antitoxin (DNA-binding transcriptional repressor) of toxin-antitoxin stability system
LAKLANMETTVLQAKNQLSKLLRHAERGDDVIIRRGKGGRAFRLVALGAVSPRTLKPDARWAGKITFRDKDIWASEWKDET